MQARDDDQSVPVRILRGRVDSLSLYEVTEYELNVLEEGSPSSTLLNFAIFFISVALSFLTALLTSSPSSDRIFAVFVVLVVAGFGGGVVLLTLWWRARTRVDVVVEKIKERCVISASITPMATQPSPPSGPTESAS